MKIAKELADSNLRTQEGHPFGACVVKDGKIIGKSSNKVLITNDPTAHAEIMAIRDACNNIGSPDLSGCELYTSCYPCPMCISAIIWANITKVYYGNTAEDASNIGYMDKFIYDFFKEDDKKLVQLECIDRDQTIKTFEDFVKKEIEAMQSYIDTQQLVYRAADINEG